MTLALRVARARMGTRLAKKTKGGGFTNRPHFVRFIGQNTIPAGRDRYDANELYDADADEL